MPACIYKDVRTREVEEKGLNDGTCEHFNEILGFYGSRIFFFSQDVKVSDVQVTHGITF